MIDQLDDSELLRRYAENRSEAAFGELVRRHLNLVYRSALRQASGNCHHAEDITQVVFTQLAQKAGKLVHHPRLAGWLYTATHFATSALRRAESRRAVREQEAVRMEALAATPEPVDAWERIGPVIDEVMRSLNQTDQDAVLLHFFEGRSYAEVGLRLSLREDATRMRVVRALERLRTGLNRRGIQSTSAALALMLANESALAAPPHLGPAMTASALASASAGAGSSAGTLLLMSTSKIVLATTAFVAVCAVVGAVFLARQAQLAKNSSLDWAQRTDALQRDLTIAQDELAAARRRQMERQRKSMVPAASTASGGPGSALISNDQIAHDLALQRLKDQQDLADFMIKHVQLLRSLGLSGDQIRAIEDGSLKVMADFYDLREIARLAGTDIQADPELAAKSQRLARDWTAKLGDIMGSANLAAFESELMSERTPEPSPNGPNNLQLGEARYVATQVAGLTFATANPVSTEQRAQIVKLIAANTPRYQPGEDNSMATIDWDSVVVQASTTLPPAQVSVLRSLQASVAKTMLESQVREAAKATP